MRSIWITGGKGFIGRHLARFIASEGQTVHGIGHGLWPAAKAAEWSYSHWANAEIESANLAQLANTVGVPDVVFHLAGGSSVGASFQNPLEDFNRTVATTARLLEWLRLSAPSTQLVCVSSAAVYGGSHLGLIDEEVKISPYSPYGFHKSLMEELCSSYREAFGLRVAIVRLFSVYGPGLEKQLIFDLCSKLANAAGAPVLLGGTGNELRDWLHISDAVRLLWLARSLCGVNTGVVNGGTGIGTSTSVIADFVCRAWQDAASVRFSGEARPGDPPRLIANMTRATTLGFQITTKVEQGIAETVEWYKRRRGELLSASL